MQDIRLSRILGQFVCGTDILHDDVEQQSVTLAVLRVCKSYAGVENQNGPEAGLGGLLNSKLA